MPRLGLTRSPVVATMVVVLVAALVGSIGLIASMPITTALASLLALRMGDRGLQAEAHAHAH